MSAEIDFYELFGFITGVLCVGLLIRQNIWNWPIAIVNALFYIVVFFHAKLYADVFLQFCFITINCYGWYAWLRRGSHGERLVVSSLDLGGWLAGFAAIGAGTWIIGRLLSDHTDAALPYADALATAISLTAQFLMARKKWENWILWIAVNLLYIGIYFMRGLHLTQVLYVIYLVLASMGLREWLRVRRLQERELPATIAPQ